MTNSTWRVPRLLPALALLLLLPTGWIVLSSDFGGLYGLDAYAYYDYATGPLRESIRALAPFPSFQWTPGYPLLVALLSFVLGTGPLPGQVVSLVAAALVPVFTALLAAELRFFEETRSASVVVALAGLFVALNGHLWQPGIVVMSDATALAAGTAGVWLLARYRNTRRGKWLLLAAAALAFALFTRLAYLLVVAPAAIAALIFVIRRPRRQALGHALVAAVVAAIILLPVALPISISLLDPQQQTIPFATTGQSYHWNLLTIFRRVHVSPDGLLRYTLPNGLFYALTPARAFYFTPLIALFLLPGIMAVLRRRDPASLLLLIGWPASVFLFHAGTPWQSFRFTLVYLPPLAILAAVGFVETLSFLRNRTTLQGTDSAAGTGPLSIFMGLWLLGGLAWMTVGAYRYTTGFVQTAQQTVETARWAQEQVPTDARVVTFGLTLTLEHETSLDVHEIFFMTPSDLETLLAGARPVYLLLDLNSVEGQWSGRAPARNLQWLRDGPGLTRIGRHGEYTLFAVNAY